MMRPAQRLLWKMKWQLFVNHENWERKTLDSQPYKYRPCYCQINTCWVSFWMHSVYSGKTTEDTERKTTNCVSWNSSSIMLSHSCENMQTNYTTENLELLALLWQYSDFQSLFHFFCKKLQQAWPIGNKQPKLSWVALTFLGCQVWMLQ